MVDKASEKSDPLVMDGDPVVEDWSESDGALDCIGQVKEGELFVRGMERVFLLKRLLEIRQVDWLETGKARKTLMSGME